MNDKLKRHYQSGGKSAPVRSNTLIDKICRVFTIINSAVILVLLVLGVTNVLNNEIVSLVVVGLLSLTMLSVVINNRYDKKKRLIYIGLMVVVIVCFTINLVTFLIK
ncbi:MAG: hypothetical protein ACRC5M_01200 [Anaeroplasmataceae bacterium]